MGHALDPPLGLRLKAADQEPGVGDVEMTGCGLYGGSCSWKILLLASPALGLLVAGFPHLRVGVSEKGGLEERPPTVLAALDTSVVQMMTSRYRWTGCRGSVRRLAVRT